MRKLLALPALLLFCALFLGYYEKLDDGEVRKVFFIKQSPTLKIAFRHLFANDADDKALERLDAEERQAVIDYCRYRLGISTRLETQAELERCKAF